MRNNITTTLTLLALSAAIAVSGKPASAATRDIAKSGAWTAYAGTGEAGKYLCGMAINGSDKSLHVKYGQGWSVINIVGWKKSWSIPDGTKMSVTLGFDKTVFGDATATGYRSPPKMRAYLGDYISFQIGSDMIDGFIEGFQDSNKMWLRFNSGTETDWIADMTGSREVGAVFARCVKALLPSTQPYGSPPTSRTQPRDTPAATQPFDIEKKPAAPASSPATERGA